MRVASTSQSTKLPMCFDSQKLEEVYNALKNADYGRDRTKLTGVEDALSTVANVCSPTDRPMSELKYIYLAPEEIPNLATEKSTGLPETDMVVQMTLFPRESTV